MEIFEIQNWQHAWGLIILLGLPLLFVLVTIFHRRRTTPKELQLPLQITRLVLIPLLTLFLLFNKVIGISQEWVLMKALESVITMVFVFIGSSTIDYIFFSSNNVLKIREVIPKLGRDVIHVLFIILCSVFVFSDIWGLSLGNLLTAFGVSSLVLGLALQEPIGNLFNGISLLMAEPFKKGDWLKIDGNVGKAVEISWRSVKIHTRYDEEIIIPNNMLSKEKIINLSRPSKRFAELIDFSFSYDDKPQKVKEVLETVAKQNSNVLRKPIPIAYTKSYGDFSINYALKVYVKDFEDIVSLTDEIITNVYHASAENGLRMPFPRQEIEIRIKK